MLSKLKILYELPPRSSVRLIKGKILGKSGMSLNDIATDPKQMRSQKVYDFLSRYEAILHRSINWSPLKWFDTRVIEIGCGPLFGFLPLAVFLGAEFCLAVEPEFIPGVLDNSTIKQTYFKPLHDDLVAIYGTRMDFDTFWSALGQRIVVKQCPLLDVARTSDKFDIVLSNSCLEHVFPLEESLMHLALMCNEDCRFIHLVDFSNHRDKKNPFGGIYTVKPEQYYKRWGRGINLLRPPDILAAMQGAGFDAALTPYVQRMDALPEEFHPHWTDRYAKDDLAIRVALFSSPGGGVA